MHKLTRQLSLLLLGCTIVGVAQAQQTVSSTPKLLDIKQAYSNGTLLIDFDFDSPISSYSRSTVSWQSTKAGVQSSLSTIPFSFDGKTPATIKVSFSPQDLSNADTLDVSVQLVDPTGMIVAAPAHCRTDLSLNTVITDFQTKLKSLQEQNANLEKQLEQTHRALVTAINDGVPSSVRLDSIDLVTDDSVSLTFVTNRYGSIQVTNLDNNETTITDIGKEHRVTFHNLQANKTYKFKAVILDVEGNATTTVLDWKAEPRLAIKTLTKLAMFHPSLSVVPTTDKAITVTANLDPNGDFDKNFAAVMQVDYQQVISTAPLQYGPLKHEGQLATVDQFGVPVSKPKSNLDPIVIEGLLPSTSYSIAVKLVDKFGRPFSVPSATVTTKPAVPDLDFVGAANLTFNTKTGLAASWKATKSPTSGSLQIWFGKNNQDHFEEPAQISADGTISASEDIGKVLQVLQSSETAGNVPEIRLIMSDGIATKQHSLLVKFEVAPPNAAQSNASAIQRLYKAASDGSKKVDWAQIVESGLGLLLRIAK